MVGTSLFATRAKNVFLPFLCGGNPRKVNCEQSMSLIEIIAVSDDGPGIEIISKRARVFRVFLARKSSCPPDWMSWRALLQIHILHSDNVRMLAQPLFHHPE
jgi:hypothetical protein